MCLVSLDSLKKFNKTAILCPLLHEYHPSRPSNLAMTYIKIRGISCLFVRQIPLMLILFPNIDMIGYNMPSFDQSS